MARSASGDTAKTLILIGLILDIIGVAILFVISAAVFLLTFLGGFLLAIAVIGLVWVILVWVYSYERTRAGDYEGARTPTLVFAILSLVTLALIPGILWIVAWVKLGDAVREGAVATPAWSAAAPTPPPSPPAPAPLPSARYCAHCGRANPPGGAFCQGCGAPLG